MENELTCCVCLDLYTEPLMLPCSHNFCKKCLYDLFHHSRVNNQDRQIPQITCPKCRREVQWDPFSVSGIDNLPLNKALDNIVRVYKTTYRDESRSNLKKCFTHLKPLSLYCQTCKRALCEDCVLQAHSGFGHLVKELDDFIQEEKDKARASIQEIETIKTNLIERDSEATTLIVNSKTLELQMRKTVDDQFEMIKNCVSTQHTKTLDNLSAQMSDSRAHLEKLSATYSTLRSDIRVLRNSHKDALQETNPERQLKLLQGLTLRLSTFLTFRSSSLPGLPTTNVEQDGHIEHLEEILKSVRQLKWTNTSPERGGEEAQSRDCTTQTDSKPTHQSIVVQNGHAAPKRWSKYSHPEPKHGPDKAEVTNLLDNAVRELRQLTRGGTESGQQEDLLSETVEKLQHLYLDHYRDHKSQVLTQGQVPGSVPTEVTASSVGAVSGGSTGGGGSSTGGGGSSTGGGGSSTGGGGSSTGVGSAAGGGVFGAPGYFSTSRPDTSEGDRVKCSTSSPQPSSASERKAASSRSSVAAHAMSGGHDILSQNGNGPKADNSGLLGCTSGFHFRKSIPPANQEEAAAIQAACKPHPAVAKSDTLKLYFGQKALSDPRDAPSTSATEAAATSLPPSVHDVNIPPVNHSLVSAAAAGNSASGSLQGLNSDGVSSDSDSFTHSSVNTPTVRPEAGAASSPLTPLFIGPSAEVAQSQCCGVGARPKVRMNSAKPAGYQRNLSAGALCSGDPKDERRMGASLKEGLNSAVCTIKSLCRAGFSAGHKDSSLDVNANDNGAAGAAPHDRSYQEVAPQSSSQEREYSRNASAPAILPDVDGASGHEAECRSVGTSPVSFDELKPSGQSSVWNNFSFNDASKPNSLQHGALRAPGSSSSSSSIQNPGFPTTQQPFTTTQWWDRSKSGTTSLQSTLPDISVTQSVAASAKLTSLTQLPKWDSSQSGVAQNLSKIDLSQFWMPGVGVSKDPEQGKAARAEARPGCHSYTVDVTPWRQETESQTEPSPSTSDVTLSLPNRPFDFVGSAASRQTSLGSPKFKQRRYQKGRKRNQNSK